MSGEGKTTNIIQRYAQPIHVKLTRGAQGQYRWEIEDAGDNADAVLYTINYVDNQLRERYLQPEPNPTRQPQQIPDRPEDPHARMDQALRNIKAAGENPQPLTEVKQP